MTLRTFEEKNVAWSCRVCASVDSITATLYSCESGFKRDLKNLLNTFFILFLSHMTDSYFCASPLEHRMWIYKVIIFIIIFILTLDKSIPIKWLHRGVARGTDGYVSSQSSTEWIFLRKKTG